MKKIDTIIIHCSATHAGQDIKAKDIDRMHRARGFSQIGYNYVINLDGTVETGRPRSQGHIVSVTMIIASGSAISVALMLTVNLPTPGPRHRKRQWTI